MKPKKSARNLIQYLLILILTFISILVVVLNANNVIHPYNGMDFEDQKQKYLSDDAKENYINLAEAEIQLLSGATKLEFTDDHNIELRFDEIPNTFYMQIFDNEFEELPSEHLRDLAAIPANAVNITMELFVTRVYNNDPIDVFFSQYDDDGRIDEQSINLKMPFSLSNFHSYSNKLSKMHSLDFKINPNAKYYKIQIKIYGYYADDHINIGYIDMNWR